MFLFLLLFSLSTPEHEGQQILQERFKLAAGLLHHHSYHHVFCSVSNDRPTATSNLTTPQCHLLLPLPTSHFQYVLVFLRSSSGPFLLLPFSRPLDRTFNKVFQKAVPTQDVTDPVGLPFVVLVCSFLP
jgi:hypothetical protein